MYEFENDKLCKGLGSAVVYLNHVILCVLSYCTYTVCIMLSSHGLFLYFFARFKHLPFESLSLIHKQILLRA